MLDRNIQNHLTVCKKNDLSLIKKCYQQNVFTNNIYLIHMYKEELVLNNPQYLICHKTQSNQTVCWILSTLKHIQAVEIIFFFQCIYYLLLLLFILWNWIKIQQLLRGRSSTFFFLAIMSNYLTYSHISADHQS